MTHASTPSAFLSALCGSSHRGGRRGSWSGYCSRAIDLHRSFIVHTDVYDEWLELFVANMQQLRLGDPLDEATQVGPLARRDLREDLHDQVLASVAAGVPYRWLLPGAMRTPPPKGGLVAFEPDAP